MSGLGLEAQRAAVRAFVADPAQLGTEYVEIESGKKNQRPQLLAAIAEARRVGATLLIAKLGVVKQIGENLRLDLLSGRVPAWLAL